MTNESQTMPARTCTRCAKPHKANGLCSTHLSEDARRAAGCVKRALGAPCRLFAGCTRPIYALGGCQQHYRQLRKGVQLHEIGPQPERLVGKKVPGPKPGELTSMPAGWGKVAPPTKPYRGSDKSAARDVGPIRQWLPGELEAARHVVDVMAGALGFSETSVLDALGLAAA